MIAVYLPHAGYPLCDLDSTYENLINATQWAYSFSRAVVVGGDFNTTLHENMRCQKLHEYSNMFNMVIANEQENVSVENKWTFESSMGVRRQLDYILVGPHLVVNQSARCRYNTAR